MIGLIGQLTARVSRLSTAARLAWLNGMLIAVLAAAFGVASLRGGSTAAVVTAFLVVAACANAALILASLWHGTLNGVVGALAGDLVGMMPPLFIGLALQRQQGELARGGVFGWIVVFYLTALLVKTLLVAPVSAASRAALPADKTSQAGA